VSINCVAPPPAQPLQKVTVQCTAKNNGQLALPNASATSNPGTVANGNLGTISAGGSAPFTVNATAPSLNSPPLSVSVTVTGTLADETYTASKNFSIPITGACGTIFVSPNPAIHPTPKAGESGTLALTTGLADCQWMLVIGPVGPTNTPYDPWLILSPMSGVGNATLHYTVLPNPTDAMVVGGFLAEPAPGYTGISGGAGFVILGR
jgi:hypothetical protein